MGSVAGGILGRIVKIRQDGKGLRLLNGERSQRKGKTLSDGGLSDFQHIPNSVYLCIKFHSMDDKIRLLERLKADLETRPAKSAKKKAQREEVLVMAEKELEKLKK